MTPGGIFVEMLGRPRPQKLRGRGGMSGGWASGVSSLFRAGLLPLCDASSTMAPDAAGGQAGGLGTHERPPPRARSATRISLALLLALPVHISLTLLLAAADAAISAV